MDEGLVACNVGTQLLYADWWDAIRELVVRCEMDEATRWWRSRQVMGPGRRRRMGGVTSRLLSADGCWRSLE